MSIAHAPEAGTTTPSSAAGWRTDSWGLHPPAAAFLVTVDLLLAANELATDGALVIVSLLVAITLIVPCAVIQKYAFGDPWGVALSKGVIGGLLTGVQGPVASVVSIAMGLMGALALHRRRRASQVDVIDAEQ